MNKKIKAWLEAEALVGQAQDLSNLLKKIAEKTKPPKNLRKATSKDIVEGALIWYPGYDDNYPEPHWAIVQEVLNPTSDYKAYIFDGCRIGLEGAYVENTKKKLAQ